MTWGKVTSPHTSSASQIAGDYINKLSDMFSNVDVSVAYHISDIPAINTPWQIRSGKWRFMNPANTFYTSIVNAAIIANRTLNIPLMGADDTLSLVGVDQAFTGINKFDKAVKAKPVTVPSTDAAYGQWYSDSTDSNKPKFKRPSGVIDDLTTGSGGGGGNAPIQYSAMVSKESGTYFARDFDGNVISSGAVFETVAQAAIDAFAGDILIAGGDGYTIEFNITSTGLVLTDQSEGTNLIIMKNANIVVPNGFTGTAIYMQNAAYSNIDLYGYIYEAGSPQRLWTGLKMEAANGDSCVYNTINFYSGLIFDCNIALELKSTGSGFVNANIFNNLGLQNFKIGINFISVNSGGNLGDIAGNMFNSAVLQCASYTTYGVKDVTNGDSEAANVFDNCIVWDLPGGAKGITITADGVVSIIGGHMVYVPSNDLSISPWRTQMFTRESQLKTEWIDLFARAEPSSPSTGYVRYFVDSADGMAKIKKSNGDVVVIE